LPSALSGDSFPLDSFYSKGGDLLKKLIVRRLEPVKTSAAVIAEDCPGEQEIQ
jgi:hypothetical protein